MTEQTDELLKLFSQLLARRKMLFALRAARISRSMKDRGNGRTRAGAQGLLIELWEKDGLTNAEIAELLDIRPSSVTAQVNNLENAGMVKRVVDENDKRVSRIFLTKKGKDAQIQRTKSYTKMSEGIFGTLTLDEQAQLTVLVTKLVESQKGKGSDDDENFDDAFRIGSIRERYNTRHPHPSRAIDREVDRQMRNSMRRH
jgi:DNA-binding MarR family transcriptional regulator